MNFYINPKIKYRYSQEKFTKLYTFRKQIPQHDHVNNISEVNPISVEISARK